MAPHYISPGPMNFGDALLFSRFNTRIYDGTSPPSPRQITMWAQALRRANIADRVWIGRWASPDDPHAAQHYYTLHLDGEDHTVATADPDQWHIYISSHQVETDPPPSDAAPKD